MQCYVGAPWHRASCGRPQELKAFAKVWLDPGEQATVTLELDDRAFAYWDPGSVPASGGEGWRVDAGEYELRLGRSSADIAHTATITVED